ncbi:Zona pellucida and PAN domain containing protein, partial [Euroglyphus maynei]
MPRIPNNGIISGGHPIGNFYTNYTSYMPYNGHSSYISAPFAGIHQKQIGLTAPGIPPSPNNFLTRKHQIAYDRYGYLPPGSTKGSMPGQNSITSSGCNSELIMPMVSFRKMGASSRLKSKHIYKVARCERLDECERYCLETKDFICKSFNFRPFFPDNCELSSVDTKKFKLEDSNHFEHNTQFDYYEREENRQPNTSGNNMDCFEVLQTCSPEGMELKLNTPDGFYGRIYTYGFYDSCFFDGNGGTTSILKISKPNGFPRCGTQQINPDAMTNIVVVQFNDYVQTSRDKKYNLTCYISGPGEA